MDLNFDELDSKKIDVELLDYLDISKKCEINLSEEMRNKLI